MLKFSLKLPRAPARIPKSDEIFLRAFVVADVLQNPSARRHRCPAVNRDCFRLTIVAAMDNEANIRLDWSAGKDAYLTRSRHVLGAERPDNACYPTLYQRQIDSNAERAFWV